MNKRGPKPGARPGSRKWQILNLEVGESVIFVGEPGENPSRMMANIASAFRGGESMGQQGLTQKSGLAIFEGEVARPAVKITRLHEPKDAEPC